MSGISPISIPLHREPKPGGVKLPRAEIHDDPPPHHQPVLRSSIPGLVAVRIAGCTYLVSPARLEELRAELTQAERESSAVPL